MEAAALGLDVAAAARGDRSAYGRLVDGNKGLVTAIALAIVGDVHSSEDVAQDVFLHVWQSLPRLRNPHSFLPWLRQLTRNRARKWLEARGRTPWRLVDEDRLLAEVADARPHAEDALAGEERRLALANALQELPDEQREVLLVYYREGGSVRQVAELLGLREDAVKKRLSRARARLREEVLQRFGDAAAGSAPGNRFSAFVLAALPAMQSATLPAALKLSGKIAAGKTLLAVIGGASAGLLTAGAGIYFGTRAAVRRAKTAAEKRGLVLGGIAQILLCVAWVVAYSALDTLESPWPGFASFIVFAIALNVLIFAGVRRVTAKREKAEAVVDATIAARHKRSLRVGIAGAIFGTACGMAGAIAHLLQRLHGQ